MAKITYEDKETLNENSSIADKNKGRSEDWNEIKSVINETLLKSLGLDVDNWSSSVTYSINDTCCDDNRIFINKTGTNTTTRPSEDTTNWEFVAILTSEKKIDERLLPQKVLWTGDIFAKDATLNEKYTNFRYLEFYGYTSDNIPLYTKLDVSSGKTKLQMLGFAFDGNMYVKCLNLTLSDEKTVRVSSRVNWYKSYNTSNGGYANPDKSSNPIVHLTKIVGIY